MESQKREAPLIWVRLDDNFKRKRIHSGTAARRKLVTAPCLRYGTGKVICQYPVENQNEPRIKNGVLAGKGEKTTQAPSGSEKR
jgi:hypothetical protein